MPARLTWSFDSSEPYESIQGCAWSAGAVRAFAGCNSSVMRMTWRHSADRLLRTGSGAMNQQLNWTQVSCDALRDAITRPPATIYGITRDVMQFNRILIAYAIYCCSFILKQFFFFIFTQNTKFPRPGFECKHIDKE